MKTERSPQTEPDKIPDLRLKRREKQAVPLPEELKRKALDIAREHPDPDCSLLQRQLKIGYPTAAALRDFLLRSNQN